MYDYGNIYVLIKESKRKLYETKLAHANAMQWSICDGFIIINRSMRNPYDGLRYGYGYGYIEYK